MADRPCKPGADVKRIWQLLLPDTPFPACGTRDTGEADAGESAETQDARRTVRPAPSGGKEFQ